MLIHKLTLRIVKHCGRCAVTTRDPETGAQLSEFEPLKTLGSFHRAADGDIIFGQNIIPNATGTISVGDEVTILRSGPSNLLAPRS
jgi:uncharacterized protein